ncbi:MAG: YafY family protein [SAR324 cluster bacterium]|nr:YafY family protein [SAR324 cluster bacterium]
MRRADRLFQIVQIMRRRRVVTARHLADELEVSERTIYRDIRDLSLSGVPVRGEAGVGYTLPSGFDLPPLMFTEEELEALVLGARLVKGSADPALVRAARAALAKVEGALPERLRFTGVDPAIFVPARLTESGVPPHLEELRGAVRKQRVVTIRYVRADGESSERAVHPLCLFFWGSLWTMGGWCTLRQDFRHFRVDRIETLQVSEERYPELPGRALADLFRHFATEDEARRAAAERADSSS